MATFIHARRVNGEIVFRVWNTCVDKYETGPLTREQVFGYLTGDLKILSLAKRQADAALVAVLGRAPGDHSPAVANERLARAACNGTSSLLGGIDDLDGPWDPEIGTPEWNARRGV